MRVSHGWEKHEDESAEEQTEKNDAEERAAEHDQPEVKEDGKRDKRESGNVTSSAKPRPSNKHLNLKVSASQHLYSRNL
jgi:cobalamin biosynthesis protein CobT